MLVKNWTMVYNMYKSLRNVYDLLMWALVAFLTFGSTFYSTLWTDLWYNMYTSLGNVCDLLILAEKSFPKDRSNMGKMTWQKFPRFFFSWHMSAIGLLTYWKFMNSVLQVFKDPFFCLVHPNAQVPKLIKKRHSSPDFKQFLLLI